MACLPALADADDARFQRRMIRQARRAPAASPTHRRPVRRRHEAATATASRQAICHPSRRAPLNPTCQDTHLRIRCPASRPPMPALPGYGADARARRPASRAWLHGRLFVRMKSRQHMGPHRDHHDIRNSAHLARPSRRGEHPGGKSAENLSAVVARVFLPETNGPGWIRPSQPHHLDTVEKYRSQAQQR